MHLKIFIPAERPRERLRIQFAARGTRGALFSVEARHGDARRLPSRVQDNLRRIEEELRRSWGVETAPGEAGFRTDFHGYWSHRRSLDDWLGDGGLDIAERLVSYVREDVKALVQSGIFSQEDGLCFHAPEAAEPPADEEEGPVEGE